MVHSLLRQSGPSYDWHDSLRLLDDAEDLSKKVTARTLGTRVQLQTRLAVPTVVALAILTVQTTILLKASAAICPSEYQPVFDILSYSFPEHQYCNSNREWTRIRGWQEGLPQSGMAIGSSKTDIDVQPHLAIRTRATIIPGKNIIECMYRTDSSTWYLYMPGSWLSITSAVGHIPNTR